MRVREVAGPAARAVAETLAFVGATTVLNHRQETHQSLALSPQTDRVARNIMRMTGVEPAVWASVHTVHHSVTDANFVPIIETADFLEYLDNNPSVQAPAIPETFTGLDPGAALTSQEVKFIAALARKSVENRYKKPTSYSKEHMDRLL